MSRKRRRTENRLGDEGGSSQLKKPVPCMSSDDLYWSSVPGLSRKVKWPVKVEDWSTDPDDVLVFCKADDAYFKVKRDQLVPFPGPFDKLKQIGSAILTQKKQNNTLKAFLKDIEWAFKETPIESNDNKLNVEQKRLSNTGGEHEMGSSDKEESRYKRNISRVDGKELPIERKDSGINLEQKRSCNTSWGHEWGKSDTEESCERNTGRHGGKEPPIERKDSGINVGQKKPSNTGDGHETGRSDTEEACDERNISRIDGIEPPNDRNNIEMDVGQKKPSYIGDGHEMGCSDTEESCDKNVISRDEGKEPPIERKHSGMNVGQKKPSKTGGGHETGRSDTEESGDERNTSRIDDIEPPFERNNIELDVGQEKPSYTGDGHEMGCSDTEESSDKNDISRDEGKEPPIERKDSGMNVGQKKTSNTGDGHETGRADTEESCDERNISRIDGLEPPAERNNIEMDVGQKKPSYAGDGQEMGCSDTEESCDRNIISRDEGKEPVIERKDSGRNEGQKRPSNTSGGHKMSSSDTEESCDESMISRDESKEPPNEGKEGGMKVGQKRRSNTSGGHETGSSDTEESCDERNISRYEGKEPVIERKDSGMDVVQKKPSYPGDGHEIGCSDTEESCDKNVISRYEGKEPVIERKDSGMDVEQKRPSNTNGGHKVASSDTEESCDESMISRDESKEPPNKRKDSGMNVGQKRRSNTSGGHETGSSDNESDNVSDTEELSDESDTGDESDVRFKSKNRGKNVKKLRDVNNPDIYVRRLTTSKYHVLTGKRKKNNFDWNQEHCCRFCKEVKTNIAKHFKGTHKKKKEVDEIVQLSKQNGPKDKMVMAKWALLRQEGDHENNLKVMDAGKGEFILSRRQHGKLDISQYGPCPSCFAWLRLDKTMFRHQNTCPAAVLGNGTENISVGELRVRSLGLAGKLNQEASRALTEEVLPIMIKDEISCVAQNDPLIVALGNLWMSKNIGNRLKRKYYTSSRMRGAARLLLNARQLSGLEYSMHELLVTKNFNDMVKAALMTASPEMDDLEDLKSPSMAIKIGYDIKRMLGAKWAQALKGKSTEDKREAKDVLKLIEIEWSIRVTKLASTILTQRRFNMEKSLPEPSDLVDLNNHLKSEISSLDLTDTSPRAFQRACHLAEARLLLYNKRRSGEVEGIRVPEYVRRQSGISNLDKAMRSELSVLEKKLLESQDLLETRGKFGRGVPVVVPPDIKDVLKYLATSTVRTSAARLSSNKYLFANTSNGVIRAYDSLKTVCDEVELVKPEKITSVNLRKYTATISQVFDLSDQQQSWLVNHLGHSMDIHKIHYRQTSGAIERIDISKLMLLQEFNLTSKYAGKQLRDIQLKELLFPEDGAVIEMDRDQKELPDEGQTEDEEYQPHQDKAADRVFDEFDFTEEDEIKPRKKSAKTGKREAWNPVETDEMKTLFKDNLVTLTTPGMKECIKAIKLSKKNNGELWRRPWETIKKKVWNEIQKLK